MVTVGSEGKCVHFLMSTITQAFTEEKYRGEGRLRMAGKKDVQSTEKEVVRT